MNENKWEINKIGLLNFWFYDDEEFKFSEGKLLLRGNNGAGKSLTMQSFIPLLLDGNMSPERLDTFGSRDKKIKNYLLNDEDERDERTAYLYMEFKRKNTEEYITTGLGLQAKKHQQINSWFFILNAGKRIGKDFLLFKKVNNNKIPLSRIELRNKLVDNGELIDSSSQYVKRVNNIFFGFETEDEYKELLKLLLQLRSPKLSNNFKPTKMTEILSNSLRTLSNDDLRPISEAIRNMDILKNNIDDLDIKIKACETIKKVFTQYNCEQLIEKANFYLETFEEYNNIKKKLAEYKQESKKISEDLENTIKAISSTDNKIINLKKERVSLEKHDATKLKEELELNKKELKQKELNHQRKMDELSNLNSKINVQNRELFDKRETSKIQNKKLLTLIGNMEKHIDLKEFLEYSILKNNFLNNIDNEYDFSYHQNHINEHRNVLNKAAEILKTYWELHSTHSQAAQLLHQKESNLEECELTKKKYENQTDEIKQELIEKIYLWLKENQILLIKKDKISHIINQINDFDKDSDFEDIKNVVNSNFEIYYRQFMDSKYRLANEKKRIIEALDKLNIQYDELINSKEIEPERKTEIVENRIKLENDKIPHIEFYKCLEFKNEISQNQRDLIEEAMLNMGILDALIIDPKYKTTVLNKDRKLCDKYIFSNPQELKKQLSKIFNWENEQITDDFSESAEFSSEFIGFGNNFDSSTWIDENGNYKIGIIEGNASGAYENQFIGATARERSKRLQLEKLKDEIKRYSEKKSDIQKDIDEIKNNIEILEREKNSFPKSDDLRTALSELYKCELKCKAAQDEVDSQNKTTTELAQKLELQNAKAYTYCTEKNLPKNLKVIKEKIEEFSYYIELYTELQIEHNQYITMLSKINLLSEQIEDKEAQMSNLKLDIDELKKEIDRFSLRQKSIEKQMKLTNYKEIKERLDYCIEQLNILPGNSKKYLVSKTQLEIEEARIKNSLDELETRLNFYEEKLRFTHNVLATEIQLNYHENKILMDENNMNTTAEKIITMFADTSIPKNLENKLIGTFHENKVSLIDFKINIQSIFTEESENRFNIKSERLDIKCQYHSRDTNFLNLITALKNDLNEMKMTLTERDRNLFEEILTNTISKKIKYLISEATRWVERMNELMSETGASSGLTLSLAWKNKTATNEDEVDTAELVSLLGLDVDVMKEKDIKKLSRHFRSKINQARTKAQDTENIIPFDQIIKEVLDYRNWFEFQLGFQKTGERKKELTDRVFSTFSGGEKAMAMYIPLFSAVAAKYKGARNDAPRIIALDEAFAGIDNENIEKMFNMMIKLDFNFILTSQALWGTYSTIPSMSIYQLARFNNANYVTTVYYLWNGTNLSRGDGDSNDQ